MLHVLLTHPTPRCALTFPVPVGQAVNTSEAWSHLKGLAIVGSCCSVLSCLFVLVMTCCLWTVARFGKNEKKKILWHILLFRLQFQCTILAQIFFIA